MQPILHVTLDHLSLLLWIECHKRSRILFLLGPYHGFMLLSPALPIQLVQTVL